MGQTDRRTDGRTAASLYASNLVAVAHQGGRTTGSHCLQHNHDRSVSNTSCRSKRCWAMRSYCGDVFRDLETVNEQLFQHESICADASRTGSVKTRRTKSILACGRRLPLSTRVIHLSRTAAHAHLTGQCEIIQAYDVRWQSLPLLRRGSNRTLPTQHFLKPPHCSLLYRLS